MPARLPPRPPERPPQRAHARAASAWPSRGPCSGPSPAPNSPCFAHVRVHARSGFAAVGLLGASLLNTHYNPKMHERETRSKTHAQNPCPKRTLGVSGQRGAQDGHQYVTRQTCNSAHLLCVPCIPWYCHVSAMSLPCPPLCRATMQGALSNATKRTAPQESALPRKREKHVRTCLRNHQCKKAQCPARQRNAPQAREACTRQLHGPTTCRGAKGSALTTTHHSPPSARCNGARGPPPTTHHSPPPTTRTLGHLQETAHRATAPQARGHCNGGICMRHKASAPIRTAALSAPGRAW